MIEAKDILSLCDRFSPYLPWLDIEILRRRYNGKIFKSTIRVGAEMNLSDEHVRIIENRALDEINQCLDLEEAGQVITPMRLAKSFREPVGGSICEGQHKITTCPFYTAHRGELIIHSTGHLIGRALLVDCYRGPAMASYPHPWRMRFERPELFEKPIPYRASTWFFYVNPEVSKNLPERYSYGSK